MTNNATHPQKYQGGCHCGAVRFEVELDLSNGASMCNCTICTKVSQVGTVVKPAAFALLQGEDNLGSYEFGTKVGQRKFCKTCGVHCFGPGFLEFLGGAYVSINLNALDDFDRGKIAIKYWDGRHNNWQSGLRETPWPVVA